MNLGDKVQLAFVGGIGGAGKSSALRTLSRSYPEDGRPGVVSMTGLLRKFSREVHGKDLESLNLKEKLDLGPRMLDAVASMPCELVLLDGHYAYIPRSGDVQHIVPAEFRDAIIFNVVIEAPVELILERRAMDASKRRETKDADDLARAIAIERQAAQDVAKASSKSLHIVENLVLDATVQKLREIIDGEIPAMHVRSS